MLLKLQGFGLFLLLILTAQPSFSQTLFMGSESVGVGLQYGYFGTSDVSTSSVGLGFSKNRTVDIGFIYTRGTTETPDQRESHSYDMGAIYGNLFPASEWNGDPFTGEFLFGAGINGNKQMNGPFFLTGIGVSKLLTDRTDYGGVRPRASISYTIATGKRSEDNTNQVASSTSLSLELIFELTGRSGGVLFIPAYTFIPDTQTSGWGISASIII